MDVALLWLADKGVLHSCVAYQHGIPGGEGRHVSHGPGLSQ